MDGEDIQVVYPGGIVDGLMIKDSAKSWVHEGAKLGGQIKVENGGKLDLYNGDVTSHITKEKLFIVGRSEEELFLVGEQSNKDTSRFSIENLSGSGGTVSFSSVPYDKRHLSLYVGNLSGNLHFHLNISATGISSDYLSIGNSEGNHTISITDSGVEITGPLLQKSELVTEINLITDRSKKERANFTLTNYSGKKISAVDGGTYMYSLYKRERRADSGGDPTILYLGMAAVKPNSSSIRSPRMNKREKVLSFLFAYTGEGPLRNSSSSQRQDSALSLLSSTGAERPKQKTRKRPQRHLREQQPPVLSQKINLLRWSV